MDEIDAHQPLGRSRPAVSNLGPSQLSRLSRPLVDQPRTAGPPTSTSPTGSPPPYPSPRTPAPPLPFARHRTGRSPAPFGPPVAPATAPPPTRWLPAPPLPCRAGSPDRAPPHRDSRRA